MVSIYFLKLTPNAQSAGTAGIGLATIDNGSTTIFHNASVIAFLQEVMGASYSYAKINQDHMLHSASLFYRIRREGIYGFVVGFRYFKNPKMLSYRPHVWGSEAAYFRDAAKDLSLSLTPRYLQAKAAESTDSKNSVRLDFGATYYRNMALLNKTAPWSIGFQAANLGKKPGGQKLPTKLELGGTIGLPLSIRSRLQMMLNFSYLLLPEIHHLQAGVGAEHNFLRHGAVCVGYHPGDRGKGMGNYGTLGCGVDLWPIRTDFSYVLADEDCFMRRTWQLGVGMVS